MLRVLLWSVLAIPLLSSGSAYAQLSGGAISVSPDNFLQAESDLYFGGVVKLGGFGKFHHNREPTPLDQQTVIRMNRDTLYSKAVFDLDAGPVTITRPDSGKRFMSLQVIDEDEYTHGVYYGGGRHMLSKDEIGTRYVVTAVRTLVMRWTRTMSIRSIACKMRSLSGSQAAPAASRCPTGIRSANRRCAMLADAGVDHT